VQPSKSQALGLLDMDARRCLSLFAAAQKHATVVGLLLQHGADVSSKAIDGLTPLSAAVCAGNDNTEVVGLLLGNGADLSATHEGARTSADVSAKDLGMALFNGIFLGHEAVVRELLGKGGEVPAELIPGHCPLHVAASKGNVALVLLFIDEGAEVSAKDSKGYTPLHHAASRGHFDAVRLLLDKGADMSITNKHGTPLHLAALFGRRRFFF